MLWFLIDASHCLVLINVVEKRSEDVCLHFSVSIVGEET